MTSFSMPQQQQHNAVVAAVATTTCRGGLPPLNRLDDMMAGIDFSMPENFFNDEDDVYATADLDVDDDDADGFITTTSTKQQPPQYGEPSPPPLPSLGLQHFVPTPAEIMNNTSDQQQQQQQASGSNSHDGLFVASLPITDEDSVNLYMFFDPIQQAVVCPRQTITFQTGQVVSTAVVGPMVIQQSQLESLFDAAKNLRSAHLHSMPIMSETTSTNNTTNKTLA